MTELPIPVGDLLRHATWVEALARELVGDEARAADLVQDTWLAVLRRPPAHHGNLRGYLGTILRNLWRQHHRASLRRLRREAAAAAERAGAEPAGHAASDAACDVVERAALQRRVVDAVLELEEPARSTVLLRFFDGLSAAEIARRHRVPVATVRTRLLRAVRRLRERLAGRGLDSMSLVALFAWRPCAAWTSVLLLAMKTRLVLAVALLVATTVVGIRLLPERSGPSPAVATPAAAAVVAADARATGSDAAAPRREVAAVADATRERDLAAAPAAVLVHGSLRDAEGVAMPQREVAFVPAGGGAAGAPESAPDAARSSAAVTDAHGAFAVGIAGDGTVQLAAEGWTTVLAAVVRSDAPPRHALVVAAPAVELAGFVVDERGEPVAGARVDVALPADFRSRFVENADAAEPRDHAASSAADGRFRIAAAAAVRGAQVLVAHPSFLPVRLPLPLAGDRALRVELHRPARTDGAIVGQVVDASGAAVAEAWVSVGGRTTRADRDGNFAVPAGDGDALLAARRGLPPVCIARPAAGWPPFVLVQLGFRPRCIEGRVVDDAGRPQAGVRVWVANGTSLGRVGGGAALAEGIASGARTIDEMRELAAAEAAEPGALLRRSPLAMWPWTRSGEDGAFVLTGLFDRAYDLRVMRDDLVQVDVAGVAAGSRGVEIRLPADATYARVRGRVATAAGVPVPRVRVVAMCDPVSVDGSTMHEQGEPTTTDAAGRFTLQHVPSRGAYLRCDGEDIVPLEYGRRVPGGLQELTGGAVDDVTITVHLRVHVQLELLDAARAEWVEVLDSAGRRLLIDVFRGRGRRTSERLPIESGRTPVFVVGDDAATLVLGRGDQEVDRVPITPVAGDVNRVVR